MGKWLVGHFADCNETERTRRNNWKANTVQEFYWCLLAMLSLFDELLFIWPTAKESILYNTYIHRTFNSLFCKIVLWPAFKSIKVHLSLHWSPFKDTASNIDTVIGYQQLEILVATYFDAFLLHDFQNNISSTWIAHCHSDNYPILKTNKNSFRKTFL